jgi:uncharacterized protein YfaS (alpha-2-macroglobulin family)
MRLKPALSQLLILSTLLIHLPPAPARAAAAQDEARAETGLHFRLSEASTAAVRPGPHPVAPAGALSEAEVSTLLARLPPLTGEADDVGGFKLRERSLPPPRAGRTIEAAFAAPGVGAPPPAGSTSAPLEVLRAAPEGEVELAPALSVTFSQPMVAVSSQTEAASSVPVRLTPQPAGSWRWLGSQTLLFRPEAEGGRFPMATDYTVTVPAGVRSALGNALAEGKTFKFSTPPPTIKGSYPGGESRPRDALLFVEFDQRVDAARVLERMRVEPSAGLRLRAATPDEIASDAEVSELVKRAQPGRWVVARAVTPDGATQNALPSDAAIRVVVPAGTPSAEGPRPTPADQSFTFKTYGLLRVREIRCGYDMRCAPRDDFHLLLSNSLDPRSFLPSHVRVSPELPGADIGAAYNSIVIRGPKRPDTIYTVTLERSFRDVYGQTLAGDHQFTIKVNASDPGLYSADQGFVTLDPAGRRAYSVYSVNYPRLKVSLYKVGPEDWKQFRAYQVARYNRGAEPPKLVPPGRLVEEKVVELNAAPDEFTETSIDLSPALTNGFGQVFVRVEPLEDGDAPVRVYAYRRDNRVESWVQATGIGLDAFADRGELVAWANSLRDGRPLAGVQLSVEPQGGTSVTGADGLARFPHVPLESIGEARPALLVARRGDDLAILPRQYVPHYADNDSTHWRHYDVSTSALAWYVFDDRKLYRPGEEVSVKGWIRKVNLTPKGGTELFDPAGEVVAYALKDSQDNELTKGAARLNALAGFDLKLKLPAAMNLGHARLEFKLAEDGGEHTHTFQVQEFRRPEFEIKASASEAPHFVGAHATVAMTASYYAGGGLAATEVDWTVLSAPTDYTPPNRGDYTFGQFRPWWEDYGDYGETKEGKLKGRTDGEGRHALRIDFDAVNPPRPSRVMAEARVQDVNRQTLAARAVMLVHPSEVYVGLRPARTFVRQGEAFDVDAIVTDLDGRALAGRDVHLRMVRLDYVFEGGGWGQKELDAQEQTVKSGAGAVGVRLPSKGGGLYRLTARVRDDRERLNETELTLWVAGGSRPPSREVSQEKVELIPDRRTYQGGDVAEVLVQSPFAPAEGVVTLRRSGILSAERFTMEGGSHTLRVPIDEAMTPNVHVQVDLVGAAARVDEAGRERTDLPKRPAYASGEIKLDVPPAERRLNIRATPRETVAKPGAETVVEVEVRDAAGRAVAGTDTAVVVVDESVLALTDYKLGDPLGVFYAERGEDTSDYHLRERLKLADPAQLERQAKTGVVNQHHIQNLPLNARAPAELALLSATTAETVEVTSSADDEAQFNLRQNFNALAVFAASLPTDAAGRAEVRVKLPDNLTRYRVMAVSVAGGRLAGAGESAITARLPLMARPSAPRFLNYGDRAELPVVVQNQTGSEMTVRLAVRASNAELTEGAGRRVRVPAGDRVEVRFPVAAVKPGTARFQVAAVAGPESDAAEVSLPVYTPATTETFATYGVIDEGALAQPVRAPADAVRTFGGLEVATASTQLQELTDAVIYLYNYPFECSEQVASRVISVAALKDVLAAFNSKELPAPDEMRRSVAEGVRKLQALQNEDGGFHFWRRGEESNPYVSVHVAHALARARDKGFDVPGEAIEKSKEYLDDIEEKLPGWYSREAKFAIRAYALFVRALMQDRDPYEAHELIDDAGGAQKLSLEALGWILPVLSGDEDSAEELEAVRRHVNNRVTETAGAAHFADTYADGEHTILHSDRRADGVLLDALIGDQPRSDLIPKLVRGLLGHRRRGRWENTQENVFILLALDRYFNTYERATPDFVARVWLGRDFVGEQQFRGRSADRRQLNLPMSALAERTARGPADLTISKEGAGRLYFRVGARYAPSSLKLAAADYGFQVERTYEGADDPADVRREPDGTWRIRAGARVRVRVRMFNPARRYHVALVDPLPAGLEALNPALAATERLPDGSSESGVARGGRGFRNHYWYWRGPWYEHQNLRDERAEAFASLLWEGEHEYIYFARATTPGLFVVPPPRAEEMYSPETFGRGQSDRVRVE